MSNPFDPGYYSEEDLKDAGFKSSGRNVRIAKNCTVINPQTIEIGHNLRIEGCCTLVAAGGGFIRLGSYIHIGAYCMLSAGYGVVMDDFTTLSQRVRVCSRSDDYAGLRLANPTVPAKYTGDAQGQVPLGRHGDDL